MLSWGPSSSWCYVFGFQAPRAGRSPSPPGPHLGVSCSPAEGQRAPCWGPRKPSFGSGSAHDLGQVTTVNLGASSIEGSLSDPQLLQRTGPSHGTQ